MSERNDRLLLVGVALGISTGLAVLYALLVASRPLFGVFVALSSFGAYLAWRFFHLAARFVAAVERIADAMEVREH